MFNEIKIYFTKNQRFITILTITLFAHLVILFLVPYSTIKKEKRQPNTIFKMVDVTEYVPPEPEDKIEISRQEKIAEKIIETEKEIKELDIDYLPQHKISEMPVIPLNIFNSRKVYPPLANKQGIEGIVYLQLYIDQTGLIRDIKILKDPGYGFGEAAVKALKGIQCIPAKANGIPVAAAIRFPVRFKLK